MVVFRIVWVAMVGRGPRSASSYGRQTKQTYLFNVRGSSDMSTFCERFISNPPTLMVWRKASDCFTSHFFLPGPRNETTTNTGSQDRLTMSCWGGDPTQDYVYEDFGRPSASSEGSRSSRSDDSEVLNTDHRKATPLFRNIERENWEGVLTFLNTGKWSNSMLTSTSAHLRCPSPAIQAKTWVTSYDRAGQAEWSQLPLHAAISYLAPFVVIQKLVQLYPKGIHCTDNEGMLPIHLAFGFGAPESVLALLLEPFPGSVNERGLGGRFPYECCELGPNKIRGRVFKIVTEEVAHRTLLQEEDEWRAFATQVSKSIGLEDDPDLQTIPIKTFITGLLKDRKELEILKTKPKIATQPRQPTLASAAPDTLLVPPQAPKPKRGWLSRTPRGSTRKPVAPKGDIPLNAKDKRYSV